MPLRTTENFETSSLGEISEKYLIFYSSITDGELWCPDCRVVDPLVQKIFGPPDGPSALIVYVGQRSEWKTPNNPYRSEPWNITGVPTIVKLEGANLAAGRLKDEKAIIQQLESFVRE